jgi:hypothetical protein
MYTKEELLILIEQSKAEAEEVDKQYAHKDRYGNPARQDVYRFKKLLELTELGVEYEHAQVGCVKIKRGDKKPIIYALITGNWRNEGKNKWYRSGNVKKFVEKFVLDESPQNL